MSDFLETIPGTEIPICQLCREDAATTKSDHIGPVCPQCLVHCLHASQALHAAGFEKPTQQTQP